MAIKMMCGPEDEGAVMRVETSRSYASWPASDQTKDLDFYVDAGARYAYEQNKRNSIIYMRTTHVGLVLETRERNYYDDSDFYAVVWNPEKEESENIDYATTRGWTYPNSAVVDATPEVVAAYTAWLERRRVEAAAARERALDETAEAAGITRGQLELLRLAYHPSSFIEDVVHLLKSDHAGRLRSNFRKSLAAQTREWLTKEPGERWPTPLSPRQADHVAGTAPRRHGGMLRADAGVLLYM